jgi:ribonuclease Y
MEGIVLLVGIVAGLMAGFLVSERRVSTKSKGAEKEAEKIIKKAQEDAEKRRSELMKEAEERQAFLRDLERSLKDREISLNKRADESERLRLEWERKNEEVLQIKDAVREIREKQEASLERILWRRVRKMTSLRK